MTEERDYNVVFNPEAKYYPREENSSLVPLPAVVLPLPLVLKSVRNVLSEESSECVRETLSQEERTVFSAIEGALLMASQRLGMERYTLITFHHRMSGQALEAALRVNRQSVECLMSGPMGRHMKRFNLVTAIAEQEKLQKLSNMLAKLLSYDEPYMTISVEQIAEVG